MISVCLASFNGAEFIKEQIESILCQIGSGDELIVSDDGSTDCTLEIVHSFKDERIKVLKNTKKGLVSNFENAISFARGNYIFFADQDDVWLPNRISSSLDILEKGAYVVVCNAEVVDKRLNTIHPSLFVANKSRPGFIWNFIRSTYVGCCMGVRREVIDVAIPFPLGIPMHDIWIGLLGEVLGKVVFLDRVVLQYRRHDNNASDTCSISKSKKTFASIIWARLSLLNIFILNLRRLVKKMFLQSQ